HNIFKNTYLIGLFVMPIFSTVVEIFKNTPHIYPLSTLNLMAMWRYPMPINLRIFTTPKYKKDVILSKYFKKKYL
ncbi:hypothetical protein, partial [Bacillus toyonensis]|uniref:hypothetical protein n=1 Tax=Bacillus toyonensis TaxID=155322 RepID=UPI003D338F3E